MLNFGYTSVGELLDHKAARNEGRDLLQFLDKTYSYREFSDLTNRMANGYRELGLGIDSRIGILMWNSAETLVAWLGALRLGAWVGFINPFYKGASLDGLIDRLDPDALVVADDVLLNVRETPSGTKVSQTVVYGTDIVADDAVALSELLSSSASTEINVVENEGQIAGLIHTSGTTGTPKFCLLSHGYYLKFAQIKVRALEPRPSDRIHIAMPLYHAHKHFLTAIASDSSVVVSERFDPTTYWEEVKATRSTILRLHDQPMSRLLEQPPRPNDRNHGAVVAASGWTRQREFHERFGVAVSSSIGSNESQSIALGPPYRTYVDPTYYDAETPGLEILSDDFDVKIVDEDGSEMPTNTLGEICSRQRRPHTMFEGYFREPGLTEAAFSDGWYHHGDKGYIDDNGLLHFGGRKAEAIRHRGEWISHAVVERAANALDGVHEAALVGVPSERGDQDLKLYVAREDGTAPSPEELLTGLLQELPYFMVPRYVEFIDELPRTPGLDKIRRADLRDRGIGDAWDRIAAGFRLR